MVMSCASPNSADTLWFVMARSVPNFFLGLLFKKRINSGA